MTEYGGTKTDAKQPSTTRATSPSLTMAASSNTPPRRQPLLIRTWRSRREQHYAQLLSLQQAQPNDEYSRITNANGDRPPTKVHANGLRQRSFRCRSGMWILLILVLYTLSTLLSWQYDYDSLFWNHRVPPEDEQDASPTLCFVTSVFSADPATSDRPPSVTWLQRRRNNLHFLAFTNHATLDAPGWTVLTEGQNFTVPSTYRRYLTASRWAKFLAWNDTALMERYECDTIVYLDAWYAPKASALPEFDRISRALMLGDNLRRPHSDDTNRTFSVAREDPTTSSATTVPMVAQALHPDQGDLDVEWHNILDQHKDLEANVLASQAWLQQQPDYAANLTLYKNTFLGELVMKMKKMMRRSSFGSELERSTRRENQCRAVLLSHLFRSSYQPDSLQSA